MRDFWNVAEELSRQDTPFVVVTLVSVRGGAPQEPGAKAIMTARGLHWGTVGGGKVEARAIDHSREILSRKVTAPELLIWNLQRDIGMTCGGEVTFLFECHRTDSWQVVIYGAGHVGQALVRALEPLDCRLTCIDTRPECVERLPASERVTRRCVSDLPVSVAEFGSDTFFVVMTQGHATDVPILETIFRRHPSAPYVGVMGSKVKGIKIRSELKERGIPPEQVSSLHCPIGLTLGDSTPAEIAISVAAELLQSRDRWRSS